MPHLFGNANPAKRPEVRAKLVALALARPKRIRYCKVCGEPAIWKEMPGAESFPSYEEAKKAGLLWGYYCEKHMVPNTTAGYFRECAGIKFTVHPKVRKRAEQQYEFTHHKERLKYRSDYTLQHYIRSSVNGKRIKIRAQKRPRPVSLICELCEQGPRRLGYHHWNGEKPSIGLWLCRTCHIAVTKYHQGLIQKYLLLQQQIEGAK